MPVPIPGPKGRSDSQKVEFLTISGRAKIRFFDQISGVPGLFPQFPLATNHAEGIPHGGSTPWRILRGVLPSPGFPGREASETGHSLRNDGIMILTL